MPIVMGDLKLYLTGGASNSDPLVSLGGISSSTQLIDATLQNLFGNVTPAEGLAGSVKYRALTFKNTSAFIAYAATLFVALETTSTDTTVSLAYDSTGTQSIVNEDTAPIGLTFTTPLSLSGGILLGDVSPAGVARIWLKRTVTASAVLAADSGTITISVGNSP